MNPTNNHICQHCGDNPAEITINFRHGERQWEVYLCADCATRIRRFTEAAVHQFYRQTMSDTTAKPTASTALVPEEPSPSEELLERIRARRRLGELRAKLEHAVAGEQYEDAARLRDQINCMEREVKSHDG